MLLADGCSDVSSSIPNKVTDEEYALYAAWISHHFKEQPERLLIDDRTITYDPLGPGLCGARTLMQAGRGDDALLRALHELGEAQYPVDAYKFRNQPFRIPWKFEVSDRLSGDPAPPFRLIAFSRVAFNRDGTRALFAVSNSCGGLCGGGGPLLATRQNGVWVFNANLGCEWIY